MINIISIFLILFVTIFSYLRYKDVLYPPVIQGTLWGMILFVFYLNRDSFIPLSIQTYGIIVIGVFVFSLGTNIATFKYKRLGHNAQIQNIKSHLEKIKRVSLSEIIFWIPIIGLPFYIHKAQVLGSTGPYDSFITNIRFNISYQDNNYGIMAYLNTFSSVSAGIELLEQKNLSKIFISIFVAITYAYFSTGRSAFFLLLSIIMGVLLISNKLDVKKGIAFSMIIGILSFITMGTLMGKGAIVGNAFNENLISMMDNFKVYLLGGLPAFDIFTKIKLSYDYGLNIFRLPVILLNTLGFNLPVTQLIREFVNVPMLTNVYTIYQPYYADFSLFGVVFIQFLLGGIHGFLYKKANKGEPKYILFYAISLYPLMMQFFQDQYFMLSSQWIQYFILLSLYFYLPKSSEVN